jgi:hypothetical protein
MTKVYNKAIICNSLKQLVNSANCKQYYLYNYKRFFDRKMTYPVEILLFSVPVYKIISNAIIIRKKGCFTFDLSQSKYY